MRHGIRCVGKYLYDNGMTDGRTTVTVDTLSGVKTLELTVKDGKMLSARVDMGAAILARTTSRWIWRAIP